MTSKDYITQNRLKELLHYNPDTGVFMRILQGRGRKCGKQAGGSCDDQGYIRIRLDGILYRAHRLAFLYITGKSPAVDVDHINHVRNDNRWINLREASSTINGKNQSIHSTNTTRICGVYWHKKNNNWVALIITNGERIFLGSHSTILDAVCARKAAEIKYGFHPNHGS